MQKLAIPNLETARTPRAADAFAIVGMAALWMSLFKRLLYPAMHTYLRTGNEGALAAHFAYAAVFVIALLLLLLDEGRLGRALLTHRTIPVMLGLGGAAGMALFAAAAPDTGGVAFALGGVLVACYIPTHFVYWGMHARARTLVGLQTSRQASWGTALSFALFVLLYLALEASGMQSIYISVACPLVSTAMIALCPGAPAAPENAANPNVAADSPTTRPVTPDSQECPVRGEAGGAKTADDAQPPEDPIPAQQREAPLAESSPQGIEAFARKYGLSEREAELASYAHRNWSARKIAGELFIAESTVYTHLKRIYRKTDVHSKQELIDLMDTWNVES